MAIVAWSKDLTTASISNHATILIAARVVTIAIAVIVAVSTTAIIVIVVVVISWHVLTISSHWWLLLTVASTWMLTDHVEMILTLTLWHAWSIWRSLIVEV